MFTAFLNFLLTIPQDVRVASAAVEHNIPHSEIEKMIDAITTQVYFVTGSMTDDDDGNV